MQRLLDAKSMRPGKRQMRKVAETVCKDILRTQKRNEKARRSHIKTRRSDLRTMGYDLADYKGGTMLIRRL